jgi:hypothetical protein
MAVFIERTPVTSSNCYETMKKCFNTDQSWHKYWLDHSLCNSMLNLKFLVITTMGDVSKLPKITILRCFFSHQNWFQSAATSPFWQLHDWLYLFDREWPRKSDHFSFLNNIPLTINSVLGPKYGTFSLFEATTRGVGGGGGWKAVETRLY